MISTAAAPASRLPDLIALAQEPSSDARRALLRELTDHFFGGRSRTTATDALYGDILSTLLRDMEIAVRVELATRFAPSPDSPLSLIQSFARDEAEVAAPVLRASPLLSEQDLLDIARTFGQGHLRAISDRAAVPESVSEVIVERGDDETLGVLLRNDGARLSYDASEKAVRRAQVNASLHADVIERSSLPADLLNDMYFVVETRLRQRILERNSRLDPQSLNQVMTAGRARLALVDGVMPADYEDSLKQVEALKSRTSGSGLKPADLASLLRGDSRTPFLIALSQLADIDFAVAEKIVNRREIDALAVVCKAAEIERDLFLTFALVLLDNDASPMGRAREYGRLYGELERETALRTVRFWAMRRAAQAA